MKYTVIAGLVLSLSVAACGKKQEETTSAPAPVVAPPAATPEATTATGFDAAAKFKSSCVSCHGAKGEGVAAFPKLSGKTAEEVKAKLTDYKAGKLVGPQTAVMAPNAGKLSDAEIDGLASYIATLK